MMISHEGPQQTLGKSFNDQVVQMLNDMIKDDPLDAEFLRNLIMTLSGTTRSMAFVREVHVQYLDFNADRLTRRRLNVEKIADFASFSGSGGFAKFGAFIGFGSVADLVKGLNYPQTDIPLFAVAGILGALGLTAAVRYYVNVTDDKWTKSITEVQNKYWREHFKPDMVEELFNLRVAIGSLVQRFYPDAKDEIEKKDEFLRSSDDEVREAISKRILPPDTLSWPPYTFSSGQSGQPSSSSSSSSSAPKSGSKSTGSS